MRMRHGAPTHLILRSSLSVCQVCAESGCLHCPDCCMTVKSSSTSFTQIIMFQAPSCPVKEASYFVIGDSSYQMLGGLSVVFDPSNTPCGLWRNPKIYQLPYSAVEFVETKTRRALPGKGCLGKIRTWVLEYPLIHLRPVCRATKSLARVLRVRVLCDERRLFVREKCRCCSVVPFR